MGSLRYVIYNIFVKVRDLKPPPPHPAAPFSCEYFLLIFVFAIILMMAIY
jgi:hypothetical protein